MKQHRIGIPVLTSLLVVLLTFLSSFNHVEAVAVMSVDLGSEWIKIGIVSPGVPMEIVLNKESKRKTPVVISFRDGERLFGEDAQSVAVRFPPSAYMYFLDLLGKKVDNPIVKNFQQRFPYYNIVPDPERGTVLFQHDSETQYSPEELLGMILSYCKDMAQEYARQPVKEAVLTVPPYFNQAERRAVLNAAELAGVKVLQLMNSNTATALNYGIFRIKDFNETAQNILFYDMGASSTVATVVSYQIVKTKEKSYVENNPQLNVLGVGYHRTLGGLEKQLRLRNFLAKAFNDMKITPNDVTKNHRAMAKLFKEAGRLKNVLSANSEHRAQVEGLLDDKDFRLNVNREEFERLCGDLLDQVKIPVQQALDSAAITMDLIDQVIIVGAGTRVPKVQELLSQYIKRELGKSINADEASAMGAVYKAADLSTGFKVKKFITKDAVLYPIMVDFEREIENEDGPSTTKIVRRTLFTRMNPFPQKKILTFNKHVGDFSFYVSYGDMSFLPSNEIGAFGASNITKVELKGVGKALEKNTVPGIESKGVKAHFSMDESGILGLTLAEAVFEKNDTSSADDTLEDTLSKIGSAFSNLFSGTTEPTKEPETSPDSNENAIPDSSSDNSETTDKSSTTTPPTPTPEEDSTNKTPEENQEKKDKESNDTKPETTDEKSTLNDKDKENATTSTSTTTKKPKLVLVKEPIDITINALDLNLLDGNKFKDSTAKLNTLNEQDRLRGLKEKARNALEGFALDMQDKIYRPEYDMASTPQEKEAITKFCSELTDWLYEEGANADREAYEGKLKELKRMTKDLLDRVKEIKERPDALDALDKMLNISMVFLEGSKTIPEDEQYFTEVELTTLDKLVKEVKEWRVKKLEEQSKTPLTQAPTLTIRMIAEKIDSLDREVKYMVNKARVNKMKKDREKEEEKRTKEREAAAAAEKNKTKSDQSPPTSAPTSSESSSEKPAEDTINKKDDQESTTSKSEENEKEEKEKVEPSETQNKSNDDHTEL